MSSLILSYRTFHGRFVAASLAILGLLIAGGLLIEPAQAAEKPAPRPPNFLVIVADDMGFSDAGCYGGEIETPNLDKLAAGGLRFTQIYSTARCWPSRTCIMTGYYAQQVRMDPPQGPLPAWARVLPHYLKPAGYRSYHSGKWHVQGAPRVVADGGFDHSYCLEDHNRNFSPRQHTEDDKLLPPVAPDSGYYTTTAIADHAIRCLKEHASEHADKPFFEYLAFTVPHFPLQAPAEDVAHYRDRYRDGWDVMRQQRYERMRSMGIVSCALSDPMPEVAPPWNLSAEQLLKQIGPGEVGRAVPWKDLTQEQREFQAAKMAVHAAMVHRMDIEIGRVVEQVRAMRALDDTVILFVSDNGASAEQIIRGDGQDSSAAPGSARTFLCLGPGFSTASNTPLRWHKSWVHEGGISSPFIVHWPAGITARGQLRHTVGHFIDILPTMLELARAPAPGNWHGQTPPPLPGRSLMPALAKDVAIDRDFLYWHHIDNRAFRAGDWKLVSAGQGAKNDGPWELYDIRKDRCEQHDLAAQHPDKVRDLAARWQKCEDEFRRQAGPPPANTKKPSRKKAERKPETD